MPECIRVEYGIHVRAQRAGCHRAYVEVHVLGIADAAMEEAQVAATLEREQSLVHPRAKGAQEQQVEDLDCLAFRPHARNLSYYA
jgi:hypothetical protein